IVGVENGDVERRGRKPNGDWVYYFVSARDNQRGLLFAEPHGFGHDLILRGFQILELEPPVGVRQDRRRYRDGCQRNLGIADRISPIVLYDSGDSNSFGLRRSVAGRKSARGQESAYQDEENPGGKRSA